MEKLKSKTKRFKLFELKKDQFIDKKVSADTVSELIYEAKYSSLVRWVILDRDLKKLPVINLVDKEFGLVKPAIRIANQLIEEGKTVFIPTQLTLKRNGNSIDVWDKERLDHFLKSGSNKKQSLKNTTILDKIKVLQIYPEYVSVQAFQVSTSTLKATISEKQNLIYDQELVPFNFKEMKLKINREENKILFL